MITPHRSNTVGAHRFAVRLLGCAAALSAGFSGWAAFAEEKSEAPKRQETVYVYGTKTGYTQDESRGATKIPGKGRSGQRRQIECAHPVASGLGNDQR